MTLGKSFAISLRPIYTMPVTVVAAKPQGQTVDPSKYRFIGRCNGLSASMMYLTPTRRPDIAGEAVWYMLEDPTRLMYTAIMQLT